MMLVVSAILTVAGFSPVKAQYAVNSSISGGNDVFDGFVSFSIEFSSFPDYAGNNSNPNAFSNTLLENIADIAGVKPYIRVGGNTQDYALYNASLPYALDGIIDPKRSPDYPTTISIGPSYFESYKTWPNVKFSHGLNFGLGGNNSAGWQSLLDTVPLVCEALGRNIYMWQYGNEPDLYSTSTHGISRPSSWNESVYVEQWRNGTRAIKFLVAQRCPESMNGFLAPAFAGIANKLKAPKAWARGVNSDNDIRLFSTHNYISGAESPGVTLQNTLLNHTVTKLSVNAHIAEYAAITALDPSVPPLVFGETNSLYNQGRPGLSNTFGAALWVLNFNLYAAASGFRRVHMHMGTNYRYAAWQPITTDLTPQGTKPPYYGSIAVAAVLDREAVSIAEVSLAGDGNGSRKHHESAYAAYNANGSSLARLVVINMHGCNTTLYGAGLAPVSEPRPRGLRTYVFQIGNAASESRLGPGAGVAVRRLWANGSDAITGVTWDGWSYNWELDEGRPVKLGNVTKALAALGIGGGDGEEEVVLVGEEGTVSIDVPDASAAVLEFGRSGEEDRERIGNRRLSGWTTRKVAERKRRKGVGWWDL